MNKSIIVLLLCLTGIMLQNQNSAFAQKTAVYSDPLNVYKDALDLYDKEKYSVAMHRFEEVVKKTDDFKDEIVVNSEFYIGLCALELFNKDAHSKLHLFIKKHPQSPKVNLANFYIGKYHYRKKKFKKAIPSYQKVDVFQLEEALKPEYNFKLGYAYFREKEFVKAEKYFVEVKDLDTEYKSPATYYYSHINYDKGNYQEALDGFKKLEGNAKFKRITPYYVTHILHQQKDWKGLVEYAEVMVDSVTPKRAVEMARLVGEGYYRRNEFENALPYLERYHKKVAATRDEKYQLGYTYFKSGNYKKAIHSFTGVLNENDELAQTAYYHIGEGNLKIGKKGFARNAFQKASKMDFDKEIQENAHFYYAKLAYETDYVPFSEALKAFLDYLETYPNTSRLADVNQYLLNVYMTTKNYPVAIESLEKIQKKDFSLKKAYQIVCYNQGVEFYLQKKYDQAELSFEKTAVYPIDKEINVNSKFWIAESYYLRKRYDEAIERYKKFAVEPGAFSSVYYDLAYYNIGYSYFQKSFDKALGDVRTNYQFSIDAFRQYLSKANSKDVDRLTDANLRIADAYFALKKDRDAIVYFNKAISYQHKYLDYARFYKAKSLGFLGEYQDKVDELSYLLKNHPDSRYRGASIFEMAETYRVQNNEDKAIIYYSQVLKDYPKSIKVKESLIALGGLYFRKKEYQKSEESYRRVIAEYPNDRDKEVAISLLKPVLNAQGRIEDWDDLAQKEGNGTFTETNRDSTFFFSARELALTDECAIAGNCEKAIVSFDRYFEKFPNAIFALEAHSFRGECLYTSEQIEKAVIDYDYILNQANNKYTETALLRASKYKFDKENYSVAIDYFLRLESMAQYKANVTLAEKGLMFSYNELKDQENLIAYADKVLKNDDIVKSDKNRALLYKGKALYLLGKESEALTSLRKGAANDKGLVGGEAQFYVAKIMYDQEKFSKVETEVFKMFKTKSLTDYWRAKPLILLAESYIALDDVDQAKLVLKDIIDNYKGEDEIVETCHKVLDQVLSDENKANQKEELEDEEVQFDGEQGIEFPSEEVKEDKEVTPENEKGNDEQN